VIEQQNIIFPPQNGGYQTNLTKLAPGIYNV